MIVQTRPVAVSAELLESIRNFPLQREAEHCGVPVKANPFAIYAECQVCRKRIKLRAFSGNPEIEDVFDAVFEWMNQSGARVLAEERQAVLRDE